MTVSLIGCLGHASLRSLIWRSECAAASMCRIGSGEPRFPARFKLRSIHFQPYLLPDRACLSAREGTNLVRIGRSRQMISNMFSEVAHMYPACCLTRGSWPCWGYARTVISLADRPMMTIWAVRLWARNISVPCFLSVANFFGSSWLP